MAMQLRHWLWNATRRRTSSIIRSGSVRLTFNDPANAPRPAAISGQCPKILVSPTSSGVRSSARERRRSSGSRCSVDRVDELQAHRLEHLTELGRGALVVIAGLVGDERALIVERQQRVVAARLLAAPVLVAQHAPLVRVRA